LSEKQSKEIEGITKALSGAGIQVDEKGTIVFPDWCKVVKIDVGLSFTAKMSFEWLERQQKDLMVFAFEPVLSNIQIIHSKILNHKDSDRLLKRLVLLPLALGKEWGMRDFYFTQDTAQSSLLAPRKAKIGTIEAVEVVTLHGFMSMIPNEKFPLIDHLKTDCQGTDLDVIDGAGESISRFICITAEAEVANYRHSRNSLRGIKKHLMAYGFEQINRRNPLRIFVGDFIKRFDWLHRFFLRIKRNPTQIQRVNKSGIGFEVQDPTFLNTKIDLPLRHIQIFQEG
jgi:FkbM family methyltransferase